MSCNGQQWIERPSGQSSICRDFPYRVETEAIVEELNDLVDRLKQLEEENDALRADLLLWNEKEVKL
jgi:hypothetical protein